MNQKLDQKIGQCTFQQLPGKYQTLFNSGANRTELGTFIPQKHPVGVMLLSIPFTGFFAATPILFITDPKYDVELFSPLGILLILPFLGFLVAAVRAIFKLVELRQMAKAGAQIYGLLIDDDAIVRRELTLLGYKNCIFVRRSRYVDCSFNRSYGSSSSQYRKSLSVSIAYSDDQGNKEWLTLVKDNDVDMSIFGVHELFSAEKKTLDGEWSDAKPSSAEPTYDTTIEFAEPHGVVKKWHNGEKQLALPFTFRQTAVRTIVIETVPTDQSPYDEIRPGSYRFNIKVQDRLQGKYYMLSFDRPFYGTRNWRGGQKFESIWR